MSGEAISVATTATIEKDTTSRSGSGSESNK